MSVDDTSIEASPVSVYDLIGQFNEVFHDVAQIVITDDNLSIIIGNRTMRIRLPTFIGAESTGQSG